MVFWVEARKHLNRTVKTIVLMSAWLTLGMSIGIVGPTLLDLGEQVKAGIKEMSYALSARSGGYAIGCLVCGVIYERINFQLCSSGALFCSALLTFSFTFLPNLWSLLFLFVLNGACLGFIEAGSNVYILHLWGKEVSPFMQSLHFMFGTGGLIAPAIARPYLIPRPENETDSLSHHEFHPEDVQLWTPYCSIAVYLLINSVMMLCLWKYEPNIPPHPSAEQSQEAALRAGQSRTVESAKSYQMWKTIVIVLTLIFMHIYLGLEIGFGSFLVAFVANPKSKLKLEAPKSTGALMTTVYWTTFTVSRIVTIVTVDKLGNAKIIFGCLTIILISNGILFPYGDTNETCLWVGVAIIGIGMSSVWGCVFGMLFQYFHVTSMIGSLIVVCAVMGEFTFPVIISNFIDDEPRILLWIVLICSVVSSIIFIFMFLICYYKLRPMPATTDDLPMDKRFRAVSAGSMH